MAFGIRCIYVPKLSNEVLGTWPARLNYNLNSCESVLEF